MADKAKTQTLTIMFTDIKGFTDRTSKSSREQLNKMLELHEELICPFFNEFGGKIIKTIGDAFMVTFHSPTDAVLCGMKIQKELAKYNESIPEENRFEIRIAINTGEVAIRGNDIFGEAVNIASRLEGIAEAGDIFFTESVYLAMNKTEIPTAEVGYRHFKGIPEEIKVYKVLREGKKGIKEKAYLRETRTVKKWKKILKWIGIILLILFVIGLILNKQQKQEKQTKQELIQEIQVIKADIEQAAQERDFPRIKQDIERLKEISNKLNNPIELEKAISDIERRYTELVSSKRIG